MYEAKIFRTDAWKYFGPGLWAQVLNQEYCIRQFYTRLVKNGLSICYPKLK